jgi:hypothetical protein
VVATIVKGVITPIEKFKQDLHAEVKEIESTLRY